MGEDDDIRRNANCASDIDANNIMQGSESATPEHKQPNGRMIIIKKEICVLAVISILLFCWLWEFIRQYNIQLSKKRAATWRGPPAECVPPEGVLDLLFVPYHATKSNLRWFLSWSGDPCEEYHRAVWVDPIWEVNPLPVLTCLVTDTITKPLPVIGENLASGLQAFFSKIPVLFQLLMILVGFLFMLGMLMKWMLQWCSIKMWFPGGGLQIGQSNVKETKGAKSQDNVDGEPAKNRSPEAQKEERNNTLTEGGTSSHPNRQRYLAIAPSSQETKRENETKKGSALSSTESPPDRKETQKSNQDNTSTQEGQVTSAHNESDNLEQYQKKTVPQLIDQFENS